MTDRIPVKSVFLRRAEGRRDECIELTLTSIEASNAILARWSHTAPKSGYDKCDFVVTWENGETYEGRYDLQHMSVGGYPSIDRQMQHFMRFVIGERKPARYSQEDYERCLTEIYDGADRDAIRKNLETLEGLQ
jgi:hypothetical protein